MTRLTHDLHVHLYGCLSAESLHELGQSRWQSRQAGLEWYSAEFAKAYGRTPEWRSYWSAADGLAKLKRDFEVKDKTSFPKFQASFNLLIALFPLHPSDRTVLETVLRDEAQAGIQYCEYRTIFPSKYSESDLHQYLLTSCETAGRHCSSTYIPRLVFSIPREPEQAAEAYHRLRDWMDRNTTLGEWIVGVDFCGFEEADPVLSKRDLFARIRQDNRATVNPLAILLHVGETWETLSPLSALRRVWEGAFSGAHRLGHATAAGIETEGIANRNYVNRRLEWENDLAWLRRLALNAPKEVSVAQVTRLIEEVSIQGTSWSADGVSSAFRPSAFYLEIFAALQDAVLRDVASSSAVVESCPSSNLVIAGIEPAHSHPLKRFVASKIKLVIGRDDPGLFDTTFGSEEQRCRILANLSDSQIEALNGEARRSMAKSVASNSAWPNKS